MKISVIVPVYNCEKYLAGCLDSIIKQTYTDLEIILIDDGSKDSSLDICNSYAQKDSRISVYHQGNKGVSSARNKGLDYATGDLVSFIDSDDTLDLDMYELLLRFMLKNDADISHCGYKRIEKDNVRLVHNTKKTTVMNKDQAIEYLISGRLFEGSLWSKLFKKEILEDIRFEEKLKNNEDILFVFKAFCNSRKSVFVDYAKYNYNVNELSACHTIPTQKQIMDSCEVNRYIYEYLRNTNLFDIATKRYLNGLFGYYRYCANTDKVICKNISVLMFDVAKSANKLKRKQRITLWMIKYFPWMYIMLYRLYDLVRKPTYEAKPE